MKKILLIALTLTWMANPALAESVGDPQLQKALNQGVAADAHPDDFKKGAESDGPDSGPLQAQPFPAPAATTAAPNAAPAANNAR